MRILLVGDYPADRRLGSARVYFELREALQALGHECDTLLAPALGEHPAAPRLRWAAGPWLAAAAVRRAFRWNGPYDVVDVASAEGLGVASLRAAGVLGRAAVVSRSHGLEHRNYARMLEDARLGLAHKPWTRRWWYPAARLSQVAAAARAADRMIVLNEDDARFAVHRRWQPPERVHVVAHGGAAAGEPPERPATGRLLFCGSWDAVKGVPYLVEAFSLLRARRDASLTVLGPGVPAERVLAAFPTAIRESVTVLPRAEEDEVRRAYRAHDALLHPSTFEGFGMAIVEAMGEGCPVIATPTGCVPRLIRDGDTGWVVPPRSAAALAEAMERVLADPDRAREVGRAARAAVRGMDWAATAGNTVAVYEAALAGRRG